MWFCTDLQKTYMFYFAGPGRADFVEAAVGFYNFSKYLLRSIYFLRVQAILTALAVGAWF